MSDPQKARRGKKRPEEKGPGVPGWIVSFSDMVTLLLAFFVLLQTFAQDRDPELFYQGQGSFQRAIQGMGVPDWLFGKKDNPEFEYAKPHHTVPEQKGPKTRGRIINARDEEVRQRFDEIKAKLQHDVTDVKEEVVSVVHAPIQFAPGRGDLGPKDKQFLDDFAKELNETLAEKRLTIYVVGTAADLGGNEEQWMASAERAMAVEQFLRTALGKPLWDRRWRLHAWGARRGRLWHDKLAVGHAGKQTPIVIAVLAAGGG
jgi:chemotaxis protein MotB